MATGEITLLQEDQTAVISMDRAHCLNVAGKERLTELFQQLAADPGHLRAVILSATHQAAWLVDVQELADMPPAAARHFSRHGHLLAEAIAEVPIPVIAAVDAPALGGGCELMLACDLALAGDNAIFGQIEALGGVIPAFGGTWRLEERVGYQRALSMMFTGEVVDAVTAVRYGLVLEVHASHQLLDAAKRLARNIAGTSAASVAAIKRVTRIGRGLPAKLKDQFEEQAFPLLFGAEQQARMHAFLQKQEQEKGQSS